MSMKIVQDEQFGDTIDYDILREGMWDVVDNVFPTFNLLGSMQEATKKFPE